MSRKRILVISYSQTGQLRQIVDSILGPLEPACDITIETLRPVPDFPFPWNGMPFFQAFPESVREIPCRLEPMKVNPDEDFDLVILAYAVWYLSPSIPASTFLKSEEGRKLLRGKPVITVLGVRNMWIMAQERVRSMIRDAGGNLVGNIVLTDPSPNLVSVITIVRWMMTGEKGPFRKFGYRFPSAGVPAGQIAESVRFGRIIGQALGAGDLKGMQGRLVESGAVPVDPVLFQIEKRGKMMFGIWSKFILKRGEYNDPRRERRLRWFKYYLFAVIYLLSPFVAGIFRLIFLVRRRAAERIVKKYQSAGTESL